VRKEQQVYNTEPQRRCYDYNLQVISSTHDYFILETSGEQKGQRSYGSAENELLQRSSDAELRQERVQEAVERQEQQEREEWVNGLHLVGFDLPTDAVQLAVHQRRL